jgi:hypothetical protein
LTTGEVPFLALARRFFRQLRFRFILCYRTRLDPATTCRCRLSLHLQEVVPFLLAPFAEPKLLALGLPTRLFRSLLFLSLLCFLAPCGFCIRICGFPTWKGEVEFVHCTGRKYEA